MEYFDLDSIHNLMKYISEKKINLIKNIIVEYKKLVDGVEEGVTEHGLKFKEEVEKVFFEWLGSQYGSREELQEKY